MLISCGCPVAGAWADPMSVTGFAMRAEELGYHGLWAFQRLLVGGDQELAPVYRSVLDPLLALTYAAARTTQIRLGVAVINLPYMSPTYLAKQAAHARRALRRPGRPGPGHRLVGGGVHRHRFRPEPARAGAPRSTYGAADTVDRRGERVRGRVLHRPAEPMAPQAGAAGRPADPAGRHRRRRAAPGRTDRRRLGQQQPGELADIARGGRRSCGVRPRRRAATRTRCGSSSAAWCRPVGATTGMPLSGDWAQIRADAQLFEEAGVTELFYDLNWDPLIGSPDADPRRRGERAEEILTAPGARPERL